MNDLKQELLTKFDFFNNLPIKKSEVIIDKLELKEYTAGEVIFEKGTDEKSVKSLINHVNLLLNKV